jgi:hypothetical protein
MEDLCSTPFHFNLGAQDADQAVAPAPVLREQGRAPATDSSMIHVPARHDEADG